MIYECRQCGEIHTNANQCIFCGSTTMPDYVLSPIGIELAIKSLAPAVSYGRKGVESLMREMQNGECKLEITTDRQIKRLVSVVNVEVSSPLGRLRELRQEWNDGRVIEREIWGISEKLTKDEVPAAAAFRGVKEELGVDLDFCSFGGKHEKNGGKDSAYLGIESVYTIYLFKAEIETPRFEYREVQAEKTTVFGWVQKDVQTP